MLRCCLAVAVALGAASPALVQDKQNPVVVLETTHGVIKIELYPDKAPRTVQNFLRYVDDKHYDGTIFHRVIPNFMIQGGGFDEQMKLKKERPPIKNEADNGLSNVRGTIAMARTVDPESATNQFFINTKDNQQLDPKGKAGNEGYCVFGKVIDGMEIVDKISTVKTVQKDGFADVPAEAVVIKALRREVKK
jgi:cyclophilin family peptidyl-prolyl cis-trans isomerase